MISISNYYLLTRRSKAAMDLELVRSRMINEQRNFFTIRTVKPALSRDISAVRHHDLIQPHSNSVTHSTSKCWCTPVQFHMVQNFNINKKEKLS